MLAEELKAVVYILSAFSGIQQQVKVPTAKNTRLGGFSGIP